MTGILTKDIHREKLELFNEFVMEWNGKINLVSRKKSDVYDLIEESRLFLPYMKPAETKRILDLGTGGGFPGLVISIYLPGTDVMLVDSIRKKVKAVEDIILRLGLMNVKAVCARAEELTKDETYKCAFDYVTARSVAPLFELAKWSRELLIPGGRLLALKGGNIDEEARRTMAVKRVSEVSIMEHGERKMVIVNM